MATQTWNWNSFLGQLPDNAKSTLYKFTAEEGGRSFEKLRQEIRTIAQEYKVDLQTDDVDQIYKSAPLYIPETNNSRELNEEQRKEAHHESSSNITGTITNRDKFESEIVDKLQLQQQEEAIKQLDDVRNGVLDDDQKKLLKEAIENKTKESGKPLTIQEETAVFEDFKKQETEKTFKKILEQNASADQSIKEQHKLLEKQLVDAGVGAAVLDENGEKTTTAALAIRKRSGELEQIRIQGREKRDQEIKALEAKENSLSKTDKNHLRLLRGQRTHDNQRAIEHIDGWGSRFSSLSREEQDKLMRKLLARQHRRTKNDVWKVFDQEEKGKFTGLRKKTLSRSERRGVLAWQKKKLSEKQPKYDESFLRRSFLDTLSRMFSGEGYSMEPTYMRVEHPQEYGSYQRSQGGGGGGGFNPVDSLQQARSMFNALKGLGGGGGGAAGGAGAAGASGATAAGGGAAAAGGTPVILIVIGIIVLILVIVIIFYFLFQADSPSSDIYATAIPCAMPEATDQNALYKIKPVVIDRFNVNLIDYNGSTNTQQDDNPNKGDYEVFNTLCLLWGRTPDKYQGDKNVKSTFAKAFQTEAIHDLGNSSNNIQLIDALKASDPACATNDYITRLRDSGILQLDIYHPTNSSDPNSEATKLGLGTCAPYQMRFEVGKAFALGLYEREKNHKFNADSNILNAFTATFSALPAAKKFLPTKDCSYQQTAEACFGDMVGEYMTYPYYFDTINNNVTALATASAFITFKCDYPEYFNFAKDVLFDKAEFFVLSGDPCKGSYSDNNAAQFSRELVINYSNTSTCFHTSDQFHWAFILSVHNGHRDTDDVKCLYDVQPPVAKPVSDLLHPYGGALQCVGFSLAVAAGVNQPFDISHNAKDFLYFKLPTGYHLVLKSSGAFPQPGNYSLWDWGTFGHIAVITKVYGGVDKPPYAFEVSEGNGVTEGAMDFNTYNFGNPAFKGWLVKD